MASIGSSLGLVIDDGPVRGGVPSSVVAIDASGAWQLLREGAVQRSELETWLAEA
jgi:tRNA A37 threonylcarbamoyladenosine synthetase subunit TsaC/SUA5/YrdC